MAQFLCGNSQLQGKKSISLDIFHYRNDSSLFSLEYILTQGRSMPSLIMMVLPASACTNLEMAIYHNGISYRIASDKRIHFTVKGVIIPTEFTHFTM